MRAIGLISITLATIVLTTTDVRGADNRRCAIYTQRNCSFATFEQCRTQVLGFGTSTRSLLPLIHFSMIGALNSLPWRLATGCPRLTFGVSLSRMAD